MSVAPARAQVTTAPSAPPPAAPAASPSAPAQGATPSRKGGGGGVGVGVTIDLGRLFGGSRAQPPGILAGGNSMASAAKTDAAAADQMTEMRPNSLVDHGMITSALNGPCPDQATLAAFAQQINQQIMASGRFGQQLSVANAAGMTPQQFAQAVQAALAKQAVEIAKQRDEANGQDYDFKYQDTIVTGEAVDQVDNSVYGYEVQINAGKPEKVETPDGTRYITTLTVTIRFYKVVTIGPNGARLPGGPQVQSVPGGTITFGLSGVSTSPDPCPGIQNAFAGASAQTSSIPSAVQAIPVFQARAKAVEVLSGNGGTGSIITMRPGANEGVKLGDEYDLYDVDENGRKVLRGHAVVTKVGTGIVAGGEGASKADQTGNRSELRITSTDPGFNPSGNTQGILMEQHQG